MKETLRQVYPDGIDDLGVVNALFRPSSMKFIDHYANRKKGIEEVSYIHPDLEGILNETYGIWVFQEQMISLAKLSGMKSPDTIRKAIGKKRLDLMEKCKDELFDGLRKRGWNEDQLTILWQEMIDFSSYSFNKAHSSSYAITAFQMAKLKQYHPVEFMTSLLNSKIGKIEELSHYISECKRMGIKVNVPDINENDGFFTVKNCEIQFGLLAIRGIGEPTVDLIKSLRKLRVSPFDSFNDFYLFNKNCYEVEENLIKDKVEMMPSDAIINLIKSGAFGREKRILLDEYSQITYTPLKWIPKKSLPVKKDFDNAGYFIASDDYEDKNIRSEIFNQMKYQDYLKKDQERKIKHVENFIDKYVGDEEYYEFVTMGAYLTISPFDKYIGSIKDFYSYEDDAEKVLVIGTIIGKDVKKSGRGGQYAKLQVLTPHGVVQAKAYSNQYSEYKDLLEKGSSVVMLAKRNKDEAIVSKIKTFTDWKKSIDIKLKNK